MYTVLIMMCCVLANLPDDSIDPISSVAKNGVYYGYAQVLPPKDTENELCLDDTKVLPMVMSLGWNPFYKNERLTAVRASIPLDNPLSYLTVPRKST